MGQLGKWAFIVGIVICFVAGLVIPDAAWMYWALAVLGLIVGIMNITGEETKTFLLAGIGLLLTASSIAGIPVLGEPMKVVLYNVSAFISAAVLVVSLKALFEVAKD